MKTIARIFTFLVILAAAGVVFYFGWVQFKVKPDTCGVLISKTGGVYEKPIVPGVFMWRYEPLIPTNAQLRIFSQTPYTVIKTVEGKLPSSELYSLQLKNAPDFSYSVSFRISLRFTPEGIVSGVEKLNFETDEQISLELNVLAKTMAEIVTEKLIKQAETDGPFLADSFDYQTMLKDFCTENKIELQSLSVDKIKIPDMNIYTIAKKSFEIYRDSVNSELTKLSAEEAKFIAQDNRNIRRLEKMGELLRKYPELSDVMKSGNFDDTFKSIKNLE